MRSKVYYSSALYEVARTINSSLELAQVLNLLAKSTAQATQSKACSLRLLSPDKHLLVMGGAYGLSQGYLRKGDVEVDKSLIDQEALSGATAFIPDATNDPRFQYPEEARSESIRSILVTPLTLRDTPIGVMRLYTDKVREFNEEEIGFVNAIANLGAMAIENAKLYEALKEELGDLTEDVNEMGERLHESRLQVARQVDALNYEKNRLETILASMGEGVVVTDPDYKILLVNAAAEVLLDFRLSHVIGKSGDDFLPVKSTELEPIMESTWSAKPVPPLVKRFQNRVLSILISPIRDVDGEHFGSVSLFRDITEQAAIEEMKTEFISIVSHELRTPLTPIKGYIDLILEGDAGKITEEQAQYLKVVETNTDRLVALVNDLLDISRIEAGKIELEIKPVDMQGLIEEVLQFHAKQIEVSGLTATFQPPGRLPWVKGDRGRIIQVLNNLITNAYKYTPTGGSILISAIPDGDFLEVAVTDTGVGISKEDQRKLFTKFFRVKNPAAPEASGTGLGLSIAKSIVEKHDGEIWVESQAGKGTSFHFTLPLVEPQPVKLRPKTAFRRSQKRILVIDDDADTGHLIKRQLERVGYQVFQAQSGPEGLDLAQRIKPHLITMDIIMPDMSGWEVIQKLRESPESAEVPVIVVSVLQEKQKFEDLDIADFLDKPIPEDKLVAAVDRILWEGQRILIFDPQENSRQMLEEVLPHKGYHLMFADDGLDLLLQARREQPELILMDLHPPDMDGYEVLRRLHRRPETVDIPVIAMTESPQETISKVIAVGADDLVKKPLDMEALVVEIERFMENLV